MKYIEQLSKLTNKKGLFLCRLYDRWNLPLKNIFRTKFQKTVLISYINTPFVSNDSFSHSNFQESIQIAEVFRDLNFNVDVYNYLDKRHIKYSKYDLIFGFGNPFENSFYTNYEGRRIFYATGAHTCFQNHAELSRIKNLKMRKGRQLKPRRVILNNWCASTELCDAIISLGNEWTLSTYKRYYNGLMYNIPVTSYSFYHPNVINRNWNTAKNNYIWIGSGGLIHKGLDLCLDVFKNLPNLNLHILGPKEDDFFELYHKELYETPNIFYHGFVDISSNEFKNIVEKCAFIIFPSCSEGGGASCITGMFTGLIPLVTIESSINVKDFGFIIRDISEESMKKIMSYTSKLEVNDLKHRSQITYQYCAENHTIYRFTDKFRNSIQEILNEYDRELSNQ